MHVWSSPLGCKNVSSQVVVLISCASHKQISNYFLSVLALFLPFIARSLCLTKLNYDLTFTMIYTYIYIYIYVGDNVWFPTIIFVSGCVVCACVCASVTERTESQHCQKVGPLFIKRLFVFPQVR